jgi:hypothetical protein
VKIWSGWKPYSREAAELPYQPWWFIKCGDHGAVVSSVVA